MFTQVGVRGHFVQRRVSSRSFRPWLGNGGSSLKLEPRYAAVSFFGIGTLGSVVTDAISTVNQVQVENGTLPASGGGTTSSTFKSWVIRRPVFMPPIMTWFESVQLQETGSVSATITANSTGSQTASIKLVGEHEHIDTIFVNDPGPFTVGGVALGNGVNGQWTEAGVGDVYSWEVAEPPGSFNPNWTVTVDFSVTIGAPTANFTQNAYLSIRSSQMNITVGTGLYGPSVPGSNGLGGISIVDANNNVLLQNPNFTMGTYHNTWTLPATQVEQVEFGSQFLTGPAGTFNYGTSSAIHDFSYSFSITLNP